MSDLEKKFDEKKKELEAKFAGEIEKVERSLAKRMMIWIGWTVAVLLLLVAVLFATVRPSGAGRGMDVATAGCRGGGGVVAACRRGPSRATLTAAATTMAATAAAATARRWNSQISRISGPPLSIVRLSVFLG